VRESAGNTTPGAISERRLDLGKELQARAVNAISSPSHTGGAATYARLRSFGADSLIVAILSPFLALTSRSLQRFLLAVVILDIPIEFGTYLFYRPLDAARGALKGLSISATTLALAALYISWVVRAPARTSCSLCRCYWADACLRAWSSP